jgi:4,5-dihydroxyphthalate decarboxylase
MQPAAPTLRVALGRYPHTRALLAGEVASDWLRLEFADIAPINRAFAPMVREARFDVCEIAIATFLQALAAGQDLVLLPVAMAARFQEQALLCRADSDISGPADLAGRRIGVRAYSQTTGMWLRGILAEAHDLEPGQMHWITFEDAHVAAYRDPPWAERAAPGADMLALLRAGDLDAAIVGNDAPDDPALRTVFPDPAAAAAAFWSRHRLVPVNHMVCVRGALASRHPGLMDELLRLFRAARGTAPLPSGRAALEPAVALALRYCAAQHLLAGPVEMDRIWHDAALAGGCAM